MTFVTDVETFRVLVNGAEQFSLWPLSHRVPEGWRESGFSGSRTACLDYVDRVWTDPRPAGLRRAMAAESAA